MVALDVHRSVVIEHQLMLASLSITSLFSFQKGVANDLS